MPLLRLLPLMLVTILGCDQSDVAQPQARPDEAPLAMYLIEEGELEVDGHFPLNPMTGSPARLDPANADPAARAWIAPDELMEVARRLGRRVHRAAEVPCLTVVVRVAADGQATLDYTGEGESEVALANSRASRGLAPSVVHFATSAPRHHAATMKSTAEYNMRAGDPTPHPQALNLEYRGIPAGAHAASRLVVRTESRPGFAGETAPLVIQHSDSSISIVPAPRSFESP